MTERRLGWQLGNRIGPGVLYYCDDCGRRFANKGWHAEACGSPNFHRVSDNRAETREASQTNKGTEKSVGH